MKSIVKSIKHHLRVYKHLMSRSFMIQITYRSDFITWSIIMLGWAAFTLSFYELLYSNVSTIAGWDKSSMLLLQGIVFYMELFVWGILWPNMEEIPRKINRGELDMLLTKPINSQFILSFNSIRIHNINQLFIGTATIAYALNLGEIKISLAGVLAAIGVFIISAVFIYATWFSTMCIAFWSDRLNNLHHLFPSARHFWSKPPEFYGGFVKVALTYVIPITLAVSLPTKYLLGQPNSLQLAFLTIFALASLKFSTWIFATGLRRYSSASS